LISFLYTIWEQFAEGELQGKIPLAFSLGILQFVALPDGKGWGWDDKGADRDEQVGVKGELAKARASPRPLYIPANCAEALPLLSWGTEARDHAMGEPRHQAR